MVDQGRVMDSVLVSGVAREEVSDGVAREQQ